jgi:methylglutaconyl-CoA hydratase
LASSECNDEIILDFNAPYSGVATITLNRPEVHNAFDEKIIAKFNAILKTLHARDDIHLVCLQANGKNFCAGADLNWMKRMSTYTQAENHQDAKQLSELMHLLATLPQPTLAIVQGSAFGGGVGLVACCDIVIASDIAEFCLSEVKLGLAPAVISPYVVAAIGIRQAKRYMLTAESISTKQALDLGLVHKVISHENLEIARDEMIRVLMANGPKALQSAKKCCHDIATINNEDQLQFALIETIAQLRIGEEAQEGMHAFFEKRKPKWNQNV